MTLPAPVRSGTGAVIEVIEDSWARLAELAAARAASWSPALTAAVPTLAEWESIGDDSATTEPVL